MVGTQASTVAQWQRCSSTRLKAQHHGQGPIFPLCSKAGFHSSEGDDGVHLEVQVVVVGGGEDAEQRRRCWKQIGVTGSGNLTNTLRAMWKTVAWLAHTIEHLVHVLLVKTRRLHLGDGQATSSNPAGIKLDMKAGFRDKSKVVAWSTVSPSPPPSDGRGGWRQRP
jgi:hypothetical protein